MNKRNQLLATLLILFFAVTTVAKAQFRPAKYVDPFIGTGGHGHTYPGATIPFGMVQLSPDTRIDGSWDGCGGYHYSDSVIYGFTHTHLSGTGCSDYGDILLMPMLGKSSFDNKIYSSAYKHSDESASPGYYSVLIKDKKIKVELTASARVGFHKYTFGEKGEANIILDLTHRDKTTGCELNFIDSTHLSGFRRSEAWARNQVVYFYIEFSKPFSEIKIQDDSSLSIPGPLNNVAHKGKIKAAFTCHVNQGESVLVKVALSGVDIEGAKKNMLAEVPGWDFEKVKTDAEAAWNKELRKIEVSGSTEAQMKTFYSALYHCMVVPNIYNDVDGRYRGRNFQIHQADGFNYYTVFSLWDTFRAWHPLMTIIDRNRTSDYIKTFLAQYEQGGLLPVWELSSNETECMIGYHAVPVITDAAEKGIRDFDLKEALTAMKKSAEAKSRFGLGAYMEHGFISREDERESVSRTLEYAYDDWCIAQMAKLANQQDDYTNYIQRAQNWKNLFDYETGFMRPKKNGNWTSPFDARQVDNNFTEANSWQYSFFVPQDVSGLIKASGGKEKFSAKLDELFTTSNKTTGNDLSDITGLIGQYAHGNEPSHHMAYLYNYVGKPWKTQQRIHQIVNDFYKDSVDGLIGNEDCGQMSAWYVLSAMGFYSVTPGSENFIIGTPLFKEVTLHLENGKTFIVKANTTTDAYYIQSASLNGAHYNKSFITYNDIQNGGELAFTMGTKPNESWANEDSNSPVSKIDDYQIVSVPVIKADGKTFSTKMKVEIASNDANLKLFYTHNQGSASVAYTRPFEISNSDTIVAFAVNEKGEHSHSVRATFYKMPHPDWIVKINSKSGSMYSADGPKSLVDGIRGSLSWHAGDWLGYQGQDFEAVIDLGKIQKIKNLGAEFLQSTGSWILMPKNVNFEISTDGKVFHHVLTIPNTVEDKDYKEQIKYFSGSIAATDAQFIKIKATNYGKLPPWHLGYEDKGDAYIFVDEVTVE